MCFLVPTYFHSLFLFFFLLNLLYFYYSGGVCCCFLFFLFALFFTCRPRLTAYSRVFVFVFHFYYCIEACKCPNVAKQHWDGCNRCLFSFFFHIHLWNVGSILRFQLPSTDAKIPSYYKAIWQTLYIPLRQNWKLWPFWPFWAENPSFDTKDHVLTKTYYATSVTKDLIILTLLLRYMW